MDARSLLPYLSDEIKRHSSKIAVALDQLSVYRLYRGLKIIQLLVAIFPLLILSPTGCYVANSHAASPLWVVQTEEGKPATLSLYKVDAAHSKSG